MRTCDLCGNEMQSVLMVNDGDDWYCIECKDILDSDSEVDGAYCTACAGTGEGQYDGARCPYCQGRGYKKPTAEYEDDNDDWRIDR